MNFNQNYENYVKSITTAVHNGKVAGNELKYLDGIGKEYYAFWVSEPTSTLLLEWVKSLGEGILGEGALDTCSVKEIIFDMHDRHIISCSSRDRSQLYVHKAPFKKYIKKAVQRHQFTAR